MSFLLIILTFQTMFHFPYIILLWLSWKKFYVVILCDLRQKRKLGRQGDTAQQETINNLISKTNVHRKASFALQVIFFNSKINHSDWDCQCSCAVFSTDLPTACSIYDNRTCLLNESGHIKGLLYWLWGKKELEFTK